MKYSASRILVGLSVLSGLLYASWPLGPFFNPNVAQKGLASALEGRGQPYNWLFTGADVVSSLLIIFVCYMLWRRLERRQGPPMLLIVLGNVALFGIGTIMDALLPISCEPTLMMCPDYHQDHLLLVHGLISIFASFCLFMALFILWWQRPRDPLLTTIMLGYVMFLTLSIISISHSEIGNVSQHYYLTLCGLCLAAVPYLVSRAFKPLHKQRV